MSLKIAKLPERFADATPEGEMSIWLTSRSRAVSVLTQKVRSLLAYKGIFSRIRRASGNASRKLPNGAEHPLLLLLISFGITISGFGTLYPLSFIILDCRSLGLYTKEKGRA